MSLLSGTIRVVEMEKKLHCKGQRMVINRKWEKIHFKSFRRIFRSILRWKGFDVHRAHNRRAGWFRPKWKIHYQAKRCRENVNCATIIFPLCFCFSAPNVVVVISNWKSSIFYRVVSEARIVCVMHSTNVNRTLFGKHRQIERALTKVKSISWWKYNWINNIHEVYFTNQSPIR